MNWTDKKKVLILAPHTDDAELGCGGSIAKMLDRGDDVHVLTFSDCKESIPEGFDEDALSREYNMSMKYLGVKESQTYLLSYRVRHFSYDRQPILEDMVKYRKKIMPDVVFIPSGRDVHQDHHTIYQEAIRAFKNTSIIAYELPWNHFSSGLNLYISINEAELRKKVKAIQTYETQAGRNYASEEFIRSWATMRGTQAGHSKYAEGFEVVRWLL